MLRLRTLPAVDQERSGKMTNQHPEFARSLEDIQVRDLTELLGELR
jgi:hypothetical protein